MLLEFPGKRLRHAGRASAGSPAANSAAAKRAIMSVVTHVAWAISVEHTADHHSAGMLSRRHHLLTASAPTPTSAAMPLRVDQSSMMDRNDWGSFNIESCLGQTGLTGKANVADDCESWPVDNGSMADRMSETEEKLAFIRRVRTAREARFETQKPMLTILGIEQGVYKHYEKRSTLPYRFIPKFCAATGVSMEWLLTGEGKGPVEVEIPRDVPKRARRQPRRKAA